MFYQKETKSPPNAQIFDIILHSSLACILNCITSVTKQLQRGQASSITLQYVEGSLGRCS